MKIQTIIIAVVAALLACPLGSHAQMPTINPMGTFYGSEGEEEGTVYSGSAPLKVHFQANAENTEGWSAYYEWRFRLEGEDKPYLIRYEEATDYTFTKAGAHRIVCYARFAKDDDIVEYMDEYWSETDPLTVTISESRLDFPNAFSPNGDGINDVFKAKEGWQSLVEFHAYIYNRWGQLLYDWTDPAGGWDGTFNGQDVKQGVYFLLVRAKGADGLKYTIKRDVNLLRGYNEDRGLNR